MELPSDGSHVSWETVLGTILGRSFSLTKYSEFLRLDSQIVMECFWISRQSLPEFPFGDIKLSVGADRYHDDGH